ncbi:MAG: sulfatase-like hydrolase/transferase [Armatimonadota bacterium]
MTLRPNIVWLNSDHYAYAHHLELNRALIQTPAFDRLCAEGTRFDNAYTVCPLCTPARASLVTGQYPHAHGILNNDGKFGSRLSFLPDAPIYSRDLREVGYRSALFGKWHAVGGGAGTAQDHGFEGWTAPRYGDPYSSPVYREYLRERGLPDEPMVDIEWHIRDASRLGRTRLEDTGGSASGVTYHASAGVIDGPKEVHEAYFVTHLANRYLEERARDGEPFCLRVDPWGPHQPYYVAAPFAGTVNPADIAPYPSFTHPLEDRPAHHRDFREQITKGISTVTWEDWRPVVARCYEHIALVDDALSTVLETLDRLGMAENTIVVYSADHGDIIASHGGLFDKGWLMVEETMRIPLAFRDTGNGAARGRRSAALVSNLDVVATVRDAAGAPAAGDGASLLPLLREPDSSSTLWREDLMLESHGHYGRNLLQRMLRWKNWKYVAHGENNDSSDQSDDCDELYDLAADPYELRNLIADEESQKVLREIRARLADSMVRFQDDSPDARELWERLNKTLPSQAAPSQAPDK